MRGLAGHFQDANSTSGSVVDGIGALVYADDIAITCDTIDQAKNVS